MKIMGLDYGGKTVGVALSDELLLTAQPKEIIRRDREGKIRKTLVRIEELIQENDVRAIILGLPLSMDGTEGERAAITREFGDKLWRRTGRPVYYQDERLTSVEAEELMDEMGIRVDDRKTYIDMLAANVILRDFMENRTEEMENFRKGEF